MTEQTRSTLSQMLTDLQAGVLKMTEACIENFKYVGQIIDHFDEMTHDIREETISKIKTNDLATHSLGDALEGETVKILSLQAPVGRDLRNVVSSFRIIYDIQRISRDTAHSFVGMSSFIGKETESFGNQSEIFRDSIDAAVRMLEVFCELYDMKIRDHQFDYTPYVKNTIELDDIIDNLFENHSKKIIKEANKGEIQLKAAHRLLSAIRSLERVGDHCCNIIERALYIKSGERVYIS